MPKTVVTFCVTVSATGDDVTIMLPVCIIVGEAGGDMTMILLACWLLVTVPLTDDDATITFFAFRLCVTIPIMVVM